MSLNNEQAALALEQRIVVNHPQNVAPADLLFPGMIRTFAVAPSFFSGQASSFRADGQVVKASLLSSGAVQGLGSTYGGDGTTTVGLPDLSDNLPIGAGSGGPARGEVVGHDTITLTPGNVPDASGTAALPFDNRETSQGVTWAVNAQGHFPSRDVSMAGSGAFIGQVAAFAGEVPGGWLPADGTTYAVSDYGALASVIGYQFGGNGTDTFAVPDLVGRVPVGSESSAVGAVPGANSVTLTASQIPGAGTTAPQPFDNRQESLALKPLVVTDPQVNYPGDGIVGFAFSVGEIVWFAGDYVPKGFAVADGTYVDISNNEALYSLMGSLFGAGSPVYFALPDLRGRTVTGVSSNDVLGSVVGENSVSVTTQDLPTASTQADEIGGAPPELDLEPGAHAPAAEPGEVRYVDPPADSSPLRAIQGTTAYGREDADPDTVEVITYAFGEAGVDLGGIVSSEWREWQKEAYRAAHAIYEDVANVRFVEVDDVAEAELDEYVASLLEADDPTLAGFQEFPAASTSLGVLNTAFFDLSDGAVAEPGGAFFSVILHEQGHGLGLGHPHDTGNGTTVMRGVEAPDDPGDFDMNLQKNTVMSYNLPVTPRHPASGEFGGMIGLGALDIAAIQNLYGANTTTRIGDDVYRLDTGTGPGSGFMAIWDAGGTDTLRYDGDRLARLDLRPAPLAYEEDGGGALSRIFGVEAGRTIAAGVTIENAVGGTSRDTITGNDADNVLVGRGGFDSIDGGGGDDLILLGAGDDTASGGEGDDRIGGRVGDDSLSGMAGEDRLSGQAGTDTLDGGAGADTLRGGAGPDTLDGGAGDDRLFGGAGVDLLSGEAGDDVMVGGAAHDDFVLETESGRVNLVRDFAPEEDDLVFRGIEGVTDLDDLTLREGPGGTRVIVDDHDVAVFLKAITADQLSADNVDFI